MRTKRKKVNRSFWQRFKTKTLTLIIPKHIQRGIYTCSLAAALLPDNKEIREKIAKEMIQELRICCRYESMLAPMSWSKRIWKSLPILGNLKEFTTSKLIELVPSIIASAPEALRYASPRTMFEDTVRTLRMVACFNKETY